MSEPINRAVKQLVEVIRDIKSIPCVWADESDVTDNDYEMAAIDIINAGYVHIDDVEVCVGCCGLGEIEYSYGKPVVKCHNCQGRGVTIKKKEEKYMKPPKRDASDLSESRESKELDVCPFCGCGAINAEQTVTDGTVQCLTCLAKVTYRHSSKTDDGMKRAIKRWNTRRAPIDRKAIEWPKLIETHASIRCYNGSCVCGANIANDMHDQFMKKILEANL